MNTRRKLNGFFFFLGFFQKEKVLKTRAVLFCANRKGRKESQTIRLIEVQKRCLGAIGSPTGVFAHTQKPPRNNRRWEETADFSWRVNIHQSAKIRAGNECHERLALWESWRGSD